MRKTIILSIVVLATVFTLSFNSCRRDTVLPNNFAYTSFQTQALGSNLDGTMRVRAYGTGATTTLAIENAKRNAVSDIIFKGITSGTPQYTTKPLIYEVNARERYDYYFSTFFADNGPYTEYCSLADETLTSRVKAKNKTQTNYGVVVTINRNAIKQRLIDDGIINY